MNLDNAGLVTALYQMVGDGAAKNVAKLLREMVGELGSFYISPNKLVELP
jgi:hypothetical protein